MKNWLDYAKLRWAIAAATIKEEKVLSWPFDTVGGFKQGEPLSCNLFDFVMESVLQKTGINRNGVIFIKGVKLLKGADNINFIKRTRRDVNAALNEIDLTVTVDKTKYIDILPVYNIQLLEDKWISFRIENNEILSSTIPIKLF